MEQLAKKCDRMYSLAMKLYRSGWTLDQVRSRVRDAGALGPTANMVLSKAWYDYAGWPENNDKEKES